ncbi:ABC transporter permease [Streptomyces sp. TRM 70351]|uniref:ABC transporter permease n=1 Tax=Streptomyces sp. TRM 70351 TaxID=3116552 RepID=UPI002E7BEAAB|nr:ABC transporter permease [Streptomyces sp. TRM 70351]MEE1927742.1 ABC transporter permease [Streptomyces sp. TRM 70351]
MPEPDHRETPGAPDPHTAIGGAGAEIDLATAEGETLGHRPAGAGAAEAGPTSALARSLWSDAWHDLRRRPVFVVAALLILFLVVISLWPSLIATRDPLDCRLSRSLGGPAPGYWFGFDTQGCDVYTRTVYGARASVTVGVCATLGVAVLGALFGGLAGFFGGAADTLLSRVTDVFFGIPLILGALVFLAMIDLEGIWPVVAVITVLAWPQIARIARGAVITAKQNDYVHAAQALGAGHLRVLLRHITPNAVAPVIVVATIALGTYIALEATLSFLGVGLRPPTVSWGVDISNASEGMQFRNAPHILLYPAAALSVTVLAFIMLGDAVRDALDPKLR